MIKAVTAVRAVVDTAEYWRCKECGFLPRKPTATEWYQPKGEVLGANTSLHVHWS